ncbi:hypothetical protein COBT_000364 [Conglomerata obtusa]
MYLFYVRSLILLHCVLYKLVLGTVDNPVAIDLLGKNDPFIPSMVSANNTISTLESFASTVEGTHISGSGSSSKSESAATGFEDCVLKAWGPGPVCNYPMI